MKRFRNHLICFVIIWNCVLCRPILADEGAAEIRPTVFLTVDTGAILESNQLVVSAYNMDGARLSFGLMHNLEVRADLSLIGMLSSSLGNHVAYRNGMTFKYQLLDFLVVRVTPKFQIISAGLSDVNSMTTILGGLAMDVSFGSILFGLVPRLSTSNGVNASGCDFASAISIFPFLDVIAELNWTSIQALSSFGALGGLVIKPYSKVTLQTVLVANPGANTLGNMISNAPTELGLLAVSGHIGFQF